MTSSSKEISTGDAIYHYQSESSKLGYSAINKQLRGELPEHPERNQIIQKLKDKAEPITEKQKVYRGVKGQRYNITNLKPGQEVNQWEKMFVSTSKNRGQAETFLRNEGESSGALFSIRLGPGQKAIDLEKYGENEHMKKELEMLLPPGAKFKVTKARTYVDELTGKTVPKYVLVPINEQTKERITLERPSFLASTSKATTKRKSTHKTATVKKRKKQKQQ